MPLRVLGKVKLSRCVSFKSVCVLFYAVIVVISLHQSQISSKELTIRDGYKLELACRGTGILVIMPLDSHFIPQSMFLCGILARGGLWAEREHAQMFRECLTWQQATSGESINAIWSLAGR